MKQMNGRLIVLVAAVAVAAVAIGGVLAYQQGPRDASSSAAPLPAPTKSPSPVPPTTMPPSVTPSTPAPPSTVTPSGPVKVTVNVAKLPKGRAPQVPYLIGREVRGGAGSPTKIPGSEGILDIGRLDGKVLAVVLKGDGSELLKIGVDDLERVPGVSSLVTTDDQGAAAYAVARPTSLGGAVKGGVVFADTGNSVQQLRMPNSWNVEVLAYVAGKVYFRGGDTRDGAWKLYEWSAGAAKATELKTVSSPTALSDNGQIAASAALINDSGSCTAITEVKTGKRLWRTCENMVTGFTPDGATAIGGPAYGDGYCNTAQAALDAGTGRLIREWKGCFHQVAAEDDQHFLIVADALEGGGDDGNGRRSIIRCAVHTGACETATPSTTSGLRIGS